MSPRHTLRCAPSNFKAYCTFDTSCAPILHRDLYYLQTDRNELPLDQLLLLGVPEKISMPVVHLMQTVHLACSETNTTSKWTKTSFRMTHDTKEYHRVCQKWFPCLWYIQRKSCTYLILTLTLSPKGPKQATTWPTSSRSSIRCAWNFFHNRAAFGANRAPILRRD
jgi:hypothetical protein